MSFARLLSVPLGACVLAGLLGCGAGKKSEVSGTIQLKGQAPKMTGLQILFMDEDGGQYSAAIKEDGTYKAEALPSGEMKVCFAYITKEAAAAGASGTGSRMVKPGQKAESNPLSPSANKDAKNPVAQELRDPSTSKLTFKVESNKENVFDFNLP